MLFVSFCTPYHPHGHQAFDVHAASLLLCLLQRLPLTWPGFSVFATSDLPKDAFFQGLPNNVLCFPYEPAMQPLKFNIQGPKRAVHQLYRKMFDSVALEFLSTNAVLYEVNNFWSRLHGFKHRFIIENMLLTDTTFSNAVVAGRSPCCIVHIDSDLVQRKTLTEPSNVLSKLCTAASSMNFSYVVCELMFLGRL